jgi:hypothetical protein
MDDETRIQKTVSEPAVVGPAPLSIERILRHVDPAPDDETERFIAAIYADRRGRVET